MSENYADQSNTVSLVSLRKIAQGSQSRLLRCSAWGDRVKGSKRLCRLSCIFGFVGRRRSLLPNFGTAWWDVTGAQTLVAHGALGLWHSSVKAQVPAYAAFGFEIGWA